jgi:DNA-directed RNA polymerase alpha subunit
MIQAAFSNGTYLVELREEDLAQAHYSYVEFYTRLQEACDIARRLAVVNSDQGNILVEDLGLNVRITGALKRAHMPTVHDLLAHYRAFNASLSIRNLGPKSEALIIDALKAKGFL